MSQKGISNLESVRSFDEYRWESLPGCERVAQAILVNQLDEVNKRGTRTRLVRYGAESSTGAAFTHDFHEEVYLLEGEQEILDAESHELRGVYPRGTHFHRTAGTVHGPFRSRQGCVLLEIHYY